MSADPFQTLEAARDKVLRVGHTKRPSADASQLAKRFGSTVELLHVRDDAGSATDEQPGGAGDPLRGDRSAHNAGDTE